MVFKYGTLIIETISIRVFNIYIIHNNINNKKYIGQTSKDLKIRFSRHCWNSESNKNTPITLAIKKYGKENFKIELIETVSSLEEANKQEVYWVNFYNSFCPNGYNLKAGGRKYHALSEETKRKISQKNLGRKASKQTIEKLKKSHIGIKHSEDTKNKLSKYFKGKKPHINTALGASRKNCKKYIFLNPLNEIVNIENLRQFCFKNNLSYESMCSVANNKNKQYKGWRIA